ncbi:uncharacterized protein LOC118437094 [Folsomia candida]|uniref:uncharacterized protein LOC118437094 n=1 Tax=Folsomia candida TaxID=158441 RepID=UPI001604FB77|nr:uncharacterized protein LOC118437094 [Folsomia candida]
MSHLKIMVLALTYILSGSVSSYPLGEQATPLTLTTRTSTLQHQNPIEVGLKSEIINVGIERTRRSRQMPFMIFGGCSPYSGRGGGWEGPIISTRGGFLTTI